MSEEMKNVINPVGEVNEEELKEVAEGTDATGGTDAGVVITTIIGVTVALCPTTKCSSKCKK